MNATLPQFIDDENEEDFVRVTTTIPDKGPASSVPEADNPVPSFVDDSIDFDSLFYLENFDPNGKEKIESVREPVPPHRDISPEVSRILDSKPSADQLANLQPEERRILGLDQDPRTDPRTMVAEREAEGSRGQTRIIRDTTDKIKATQQPLLQAMDMIEQRRLDILGMPVTTPSQERMQRQALARLGKYESQVSTVLGRVEEHFGGKAYRSLDVESRSMVNGLMQNGVSATEALEATAYDRETRSLFNQATVTLDNASRNSLLEKLYSDGVIKKTPYGTIAPAGNDLKVLQASLQSILGGSGPRGTRGGGEDEFETAIGAATATRKTLEEIDENLEVFQSMTGAQRTPEVAAQIQTLQSERERILNGSPQKKAMLAQNMLKSRIKEGNPIIDKAELRPGGDMEWLSSAVPTIVVGDTTAGIIQDPGKVYTGSTDLQTNMALLREKGVDGAIVVDFDSIEPRNGVTPSAQGLQSLLQQPGVRLRHVKDGDTRIPRITTTNSGAITAGVKDGLGKEGAMAGRLVARSIPGVGPMVDTFVDSMDGMTKTNKGTQDNLDVVIEVYNEILARASKRAKDATKATKEREKASEARSKFWE